MFDIGLDKIATVIIDKSANDFGDFFTKIKPKHTEQKDVKIGLSRSPSRLSQKQPKKELQSRKKKLLKELQQVDLQIQKAKMQKSRISTHKKTENDYESPQILNRAAQLVARMNQKRKQTSLAHQKQHQKMQIRIQHSLKKFNELKQIKQKQKQQRRHQIQQRIQKRKQKIKVMQQFSKKSNSLIKQLQGYRVSLPNINHYRNPQSSEGVKQALQNSQIKQKQSHPKTYPKSPFLQQIQKQQINNKRQLYIKSYQKKKIRQRQQTYGRKVRKNLKQSSLFVTD